MTSLAVCMDPGSKRSLFVQNYAHIALVTGHVYSHDSAMCDYQTIAIKLEQVNL